MHQHKQMWGAGVAVLVLCSIVGFVATAFSQSKLGQGQSASGGMFLNRTNLLPVNPRQLNYGVAVSDIDNDGKMEWIVAGYGFRNLVLKWNGKQFVDVTPSVLADRSRQAIGVATCDIDGDGREELYVLNTDSFAGRKRFGDRLFAHRKGKWVDLFSLKQNVGDRNLTAGRSVACVDREGDGRYEVLVANYGGPMRLYKWSKGDRIKDIAMDARVDLTTGGRAVVSAPLVTSRMDIFAANENGPNFLFRNNGDGTFSEMARQAKVRDPRNHGRGIAILDANQDGFFDIVYGNWEGPHRMFVRTGNVYFEDKMPKEMAIPSKIRTVIAADFDNNGYEELFFNNIGQPNRLFAYRKGRWQKADIGDALEPKGLGTGGAVGDLDGDGRLELLVSHGEAGAQPLTLYHSRSLGHAWIRIMPLTQFGAPARGAVVTLQTSQRTQRRVIDAGSGYLCQMEPIAHFGLGQERTIKRVTVTWPDGTARTLRNLAVEQVHRVAYPKPMKPGKPIPRR